MPTTLTQTLGKKCLFICSSASSKMFCEPCTMWNHFLSYTLDGFPGRPLIQNEFSQWLIHSEILWFWQYFHRNFTFYNFSRPSLQKRPRIWAFQFFPKNFWKYEQNRRDIFLAKKNTFRDSSKYAPFKWLKYLCLYK